MKAQMDIRGAAMDNYSAEQHMIAQQVKANGAAVAQLTMRQFDNEAAYDDDDGASMLFGEKASFQNVFARDKETVKAETSKIRRHPHRIGKRDTFPSTAMPKMQFSKFDGTDPKIWKDNYQSYFDLYRLLEGMWITAAHLHFEGNVAKWYQAYKLNHTFRDWDHFCAVMEEEFGADDY